MDKILIAITILLVVFALNPRISITRADSKNPEEKPSEDYEE
jgi:hypothetical protein